MRSALSIPAFCLTLGHAFLPPLPDGSERALRKELADDLAALAEEETLDLSDQITALRNALTAFAEEEALLVHYSCLFLAPPVCAPLNLGYYIDGSINGPVVEEIEYLQGCYGRCELEAFRDLPDHLSSLLEFQAMLFWLPDAEADRLDLIHRVMLPGLLKLCHTLAAESQLASPYLHLARIAHMVLEYAVSAGETQSSDLPRQRRPADQFSGNKAWRNCSACHKPYVREREFEIMAGALQAANHPCGHLSLCPCCRNASPDWIEKKYAIGVGYGNLDLTAMFGR